MISFRSIKDPWNFNIMLGRYYYVYKVIPTLLKNMESQGFIFRQGDFFLLQHYILSRDIKGIKKVEHYLSQY